MKSSCSDPQCGCLDRRQFLKLTGTAAFSLALTSPAGAIAGPFEPADTADHFVPADKKLMPGWIASLTAKGEPTWYSGDDLKQIGMPVGGICAGQLYLAGDGRLVHWDIFNEPSEEGQPRTNYEVFPAPIARVQQGFSVMAQVDGKASVRSLDKEGFPGVRFRGEYPIGKVEYLDPDFPVAVKLEAFSPFIPLNSADSSLPATILQFKLKNTASKPLEVTLAGSLGNAVCCLSGGAIGCFHENRFVKNGNFSMIVESAQPLPPDAAPARPALVIADFEQGNYGSWTVEGEAFGTAPAGGTLAGQQQVSGFVGKGLVNTFLGGDKPRGKLTSPPFKVERKFLNFLIGGGSHRGETCINLLVDGKVVRSAAGKDNERLFWNGWDVMEFEDKEARIEIVDRNSGGWGHINIDQIELSDATRHGFGGPLEKQPDFGTMSLAIFDAGPQVSHTSNLGGLRLDEWMGGTASIGTTTQDLARDSSGKPLIGALSKRMRLRAGEEQTVTFVVAWHFANLPEHGNHYGTRFKNAQEVAEYIGKDFERLAGQTRLWRQTWYESSMPWWLLDRLFAPVSILASATCQRWENGRFWAWEGVRCCAGTCAHVWNYSHALARLFPDLERSVREMQDFGTGFVEATGAINFRGESNDFWAGDSQGGTALKCLREHQMSTNQEFLKRNWPRIRKSVEFLIKEDANSDGLIEGSQHNTYDINFFGANTMVGSLYLGALRAAEELAMEVGDLEFARKCHEIFETGSRLTVEKLFNGEYFIQSVDLKQHPKHQYGDGCLSDQLFGQGWAHQVGLGHIYPKETVLSALKAIWTYNWAPDIGPQNKAHPPQRWFARPGEAGLFTCTWPKSKHLGPDSVLYRDEIWTGIEYQVAGHMAWEGMVTEALAICRAVHERYHPSKQNPWNEVECGDHYARAMASHGVFLGLCGFECHGPKGRLGFAPRLNPEDFRAAFTTAEGWGTFSQKISGPRLTAELDVKYGKVPLRSIRLELPQGRKLQKAALSVNGKRVEATAAQEGSKVVLTANSGGANIEQGGKLQVRLTMA